MEVLQSYAAAQQNSSFKGQKLLGARKRSTCWPLLSDDGGTKPVLRAKSRCDGYAADIALLTLADPPVACNLPLTHGV